MAIMGGAIMPKLMGWMSDHFGHVEGHYGRIVETTGHINQNLMAPGFAVPLVSFLVIAVYGFFWKSLCKGAE
jgi:fucose permease